MYEQDKVNQEATSSAEYANHRTPKNPENRVSRAYLELDMDDTEKPAVPPKGVLKRSISMVPIHCLLIFKVG